MCVNEPLVIVADADPFTGGQQGPARSQRRVFRPRGVCEALLQGETVSGLKYFNTLCWQKDLKVSLTVLLFFGISFF